MIRPSEIGADTHSMVAAEKNEFYELLTCVYQVDPIYQPLPFGFWLSSESKNAIRDMKGIVSSGNPNSEEGKAIISEAKEIKEHMWRNQAAQFCACPDEAHTGLTTSPPLCEHCEAQ